MRRATPPFWRPHCRLWVAGCSPGASGKPAEDDEQEKLRLRTGNELNEFENQLVGKPCLNMVQRLFPQLRIFTKDLLTLQRWACRVTETLRKHLLIMF